MSTHTAGRLFRAGLIVVTAGLISVPLGAQDRQVLFQKIDVENSTAFVYFLNRVAPGEIDVYVRFLRFDPVEYRRTGYIELTRIHDAEIRGQATVRGWLGPAREWVDKIGTVLPEGEMLISLGDRDGNRYSPSLAAEQYASPTEEGGEIRLRFVKLAGDSDERFAIEARGTPVAGRMWVELTRFEAQQLLDAVQESLPILGMDRPIRRR